MAERKWVFYPQGPVAELIDKLGPTDPAVKQGLELLEQELEKLIGEKL